MGLSRRSEDIDCVSTDGLEVLFADDSQGENRISPDGSHCESVESNLVLTAAEASTLLKIPISTIYRRIKAGKFKTCQGDDGTVRILIPSDKSNENHPPDGDSQRESRQDSSNPIDSHGGVDDSQPIELFDNVWRLLQEKDQKLEAATFRIGYLEAQLAAKDDQIKLLTDNQAKKKPWWQRIFGSPINS